MASIKELRQKIVSLKNTNKITSAMKLVASSKLKKAQDALHRNQPYLRSLDEVVKRVMSCADDIDVNFMKPVESPKNIRIILLSTDKGLCGSFNANLMKLLHAELKGKWINTNVELIAVGKKGSEYFTRRCPVKNLESKPGLPAKIPISAALEIADKAISDFSYRNIDAVYVVYNHFSSMILQTPVIESILPIKVPEEKEKVSLDYEFEPNAEEMLKSIVPQLVQATIYRAMLENVLGENVARMNAMENATKNSKDLISRYTLTMNRARQSAITTELSEIVAGAESLKN